MFSKRGLRLFYLFLVFLTGIFPFALSAQDNRTEQYSVNEGLSQSTVTAIYQDSRGYIWAGTGYGLNRFDGYSFTVFKHDPYDPHSISDNSIRKIIEDTIRKVLWVGTDNGLNRFDPVKGKFINILAGDTNFFRWSVTPAWIDSDKLWFYCPMNGLFTYHFGTGKITLVLSVPAVSWAFSGGEPYELWFQDSAASLHMYDCSSGKHLQFSLPGEYKNHGLTHFTQTATNEGYVFNGQGILKLDIATGKLTHELPGNVARYTRNKNIKHCYRDKAGNYWLSIPNEGLFVFNKEWELIRSHKKESAATTHRNFSFDQVVTIVPDKAGNVWVGSDGSGLARISNTHFETSLPGTFIKCFYMDDEERLWVGTFNEGIYIIDRRKGTSIKVLPDAKNGMPSPTVSLFFEDRDKNFFVGTAQGLALLDRRSFTFKPVVSVTAAVEHIYGIEQTADGTIWVGTEDGLFKAVNVKGKWHLEETGMNNVRICALFKDSKGKILVAGKGGDLFVIKHDGSFKRVFSPSENKLFSGSISLRSFIEDKMGQIWAASDYGLLLFDENYKLVKAIGERDGLADNFIYGILQAENGELWYSSNKGIGKYDPATGKCRNYTVADGLQSTEFNSLAFYCSQNGEFFFGGVSGYNSFYPLLVKDNPVAPGIAFSEFSVSDARYDAADSLAALNKEIRVPYNENTISFMLSALEFTDPSRNTYAYKLEGHDKDFFLSGTKRFVRYSSIPPGTYRFLAKAANADGVWSSPQHLFTIVVTPPFWKTQWFIILVVVSGVLAVTFLVYGITRWKYKKKLAVLERQREIDKVRTRISKDIHDDIGAGLTRIALISEAARMELQQKKNIDERLITLSGSAREISQSLREIVWSMSPGHDNMASLLDYVRNYSLMFFDEAGISANINFPEQLPQSVISPDFTRNLFMIVKEACNNIVKHAGATKTEITFTGDGTAFTLIVRDNGRGFSFENKGKFTNGIANMKKRAHEISCSFSIETSAEQGTTIKVSSIKN